MLDVLIQNAQVVDGTNTPGYSGDVAIEGDHIAGVGSLQGAAAKAVIDATSRVVVPGFIDMHSHADLSLLVAPEGESLVHQGITTVVTGQCGVSPAPLTRKYRRDTLATLSMFVSPQVPMPWDEVSSFDCFLDYLECIETSVNVVPLVGQGMIRAAVMGYSAAQPSEAQIGEMQQLVRQAMDWGAFGLSTGLIYPPGSFSSTEELIQVTRAVGERNGLYFSHVRNEAETLIEAVAEAIEIGRQAGVPVQLCHFKAGGQKNWDKAARALELIDEARARGLDVSADMYPYLAGWTSLAVLLPRWALEGGVPAVLRRLVLPWERKKIIRGMQAGQGGVVEQIEWDKVLISGARRKEYVGHDVAELAAKEGIDPYAWTCNAVLKTLGNIQMIISLMAEDNVRLQLRHPAMMIGTDGLGMTQEGPLAWVMRHPRCFGTYPRLLGQYVREEGVLSLEEASWKASGFPAQKLGLAERGLIKQGYKADLVVFDPVAIQDRATYAEPLQYPAGIEYVFVNGEMVIDRGQQTRARPGKVIRREP
jgi:N-acyl-D-aspartate/D-glutamate deacylase